MANGGRSVTDGAASVAVLSNLLLQATDFLATRFVVEEFAFAVCTHARDALPGVECGQLASCLGAEALTLDLFGFVSRGLRCSIRFGGTAFAERGLWIDVRVGRVQRCAARACGFS